MSGAVQSCKEVSVTDAKWQNVDKISIACSSVGSKVYIKLDTKNFKEGDEIKVNIVDNTNNSAVIRENVAVKIRKEDNSDSIIAISEEIEVEKEWLFKELAIVVPEFTYEEDAERNICETKLSGLTGSKLSVIADYLDVRIKVLDVRSNKPVANAVVKSVKIIDESGNAELLKTEFDHKETKLGSVSESNTRSKLSIKALKSLLNKTDKEADSYDDKWKKAYKEYWNARIPEAKIEYPQQGIPKDNILDLIIRDYNDQVATDNNGILTIHIPSALLKDKSARIEIGFWNFPVVKESLVSGQGFCRDIDPVAGQAEDTHFIVSWGNGTQSTEWGGNFNWIASNPGQNPEEGSSNHAELKVSESLIIKDSAEETFSIKPNLRSFLYTKDGDPHFILFAMEWCQPVWDDIEDVLPENGVRSNNNSFVNGMVDNEWVSGLHMHMVSKYGTGYGRDPHGHYYGFFDTHPPTHRARQNGTDRPHQGVDIHSGPNGNNPVFAVHGGRLASSLGEGYGNRAFLRLYPTQNNPSFHYAHLSSIPTKQYVMAGEIFGNCGRTGYESETTAPSHLHFEFIDPLGLKVEFSMIRNTNISPLNNIDDHNALLFPGNKLPIMLPCKCNLGSLSSDCNFGSRNAQRTCWAVREFPYTLKLLRKSSNSLTDTGVVKSPNNDSHHPSNFPIEDGIVKRFICPCVCTSNNPDRRTQLQAKLRFVFENSGLLNIPRSAYLTNKRVDDDAVSNDIDGVVGNTTYSWVLAILEAYKESLEEDDPLKNTIISNISTSTSHTRMFVDRYINNPNSPTNNAFVDNTYDWFESFEYTPN